jgi:hypothetical protein
MSSGSCHVACCGAFIFIGLIFFSGCRKIFKSDSGQLSSSDLGYYTTTELGPKLVDTTGQVSGIDGYTDKRSYLPGEMVAYYLSGNRTGQQQIWFADANNNKAFSISANVQIQLNKGDKPWENGFLYDKTVSSPLPADLKSGVYFIDGYFVPIVCKSLSSAHDITVIYPTNTMDAYNTNGGKSLYRPDLSDRSTVVSFRRPMRYSPDNTGLGFLKWIISQPYDVNYICDEDVENYDTYANSKTLIIIGHSEYWTRRARENVDRFVQSGKNLLVLAGNTMWWQVRYNHSKDLMICYKDENLDPISDILYKTARWYLPEFNYPIVQTIGADFVGGGYGQKLPNRWNGYKIVQSNSPLFKGTGLGNGDVLALRTQEYDGAPLVGPLLPTDTATPVINNGVLKFNKVELLAYDHALKNPMDFPMGAPAGGAGTFMVFQKTPSSGTVVNVASMDWCDPWNFDDTGSQAIKQITKNMIDATLQHQSLFSK